MKLKVWGIEEARKRNLAPRIGHIYEEVSHSARRILRLKKAVAMKESVLTVVEGVRCAPRRRREGRVPVLM